MTNNAILSVTDVFWYLGQGSNPVRPDTLTLDGYELIRANQLQRLKPEQPLTKRGQLLKAQYPDEPERWQHLVSKAKNAKVKPVDLWLFVIGDSEFQTIPHPPQFPDGRLVEEHELGELPPLEAELGRFFYETLRLCKRLGRGRLPLTFQLRQRRPGDGFVDPAIEVYSHPSVETLFPGTDPSIPYPKNDCFLSDYLTRHIGTNVKFMESDLSSSVYKDLLATRRLTIGLEAFFALADYFDLLPYPKVQEFLLRSIREGDLVMGRRMKIEKKITLPKVKGSRSAAAEPFPVEILELPLIAVIGEQSYAVRLNILDPCAQLGQSGSSYVKYHACAGEPISAKSEIPKEQMGFMFAHYTRAACHDKVKAGHFGRLLTADSQIYVSASNIYNESPQAFVSYSAGDVATLDKAMLGVERMFRTSLYGALGWESYYKRIKMTAGASVLDFVKAGFLKRMEEPMRAIPNRVQFLRDIGCSEGQADSIDAQWDETGVIPDKAIKWLLTNAFEVASSEEIAKENNLIATNSKVLGGRCINLAPHIPSLKGVLCDMDAASCYTKSLTVQELPFGRPRFIGGAYVRNKPERNDYRPLGEILERYRDQLMPGLFQIWITCENLPIPQDFFPTWDKPRTFTDFDSEEVAVWLERQDLVKHFLSEFTDSPLTWDSLQWLDNVASKETRNYILKNAYVTSMAWYPKEYRCKNESEYIKRTMQWQKEKSNSNKSTVVGSKEVNVKNENPYWFSVNLGELAINKFNSERQIHKKATKAYKIISDRNVKTAADVLKLDDDDQKLITDVLSGIMGRAGYEGGIDKLIEDSGYFEKYPLDELFKLAANTTYGVMVSRFFIMSNPIVGNNITARVRAFIWYYEKACASMMSITDGGVFDLNRVVYPRRKDRNLNEKALTLLHNFKYTELNDLGVARRPIGGFEKIYWTDDGGLVFEHKDSAKTRRFDSKKITGPNSACEMIDKLTMEHTRLVFGYALDNIDVLNPKTTPFQFEAKGIVKNFALQGQSNYLLSGGSHGAYKNKTREMVAMRGIKKNLHPTYVAPFFRQLISNPEAVKRDEHARVYIQPTILKTGEYAERFNSYYGQTFLQPGDSYYKAGLLRECSISGLRFHTHKQFKAWETRHQRMRDYKIKPSDNGAVISGGQSFESFFINEDQSLNHLAMMTDLNRRVLEKRYPSSMEGTDHPSVEIFATTKSRLKSLVASHDRVSFLEHDKLSKRLEEVEEAYRSELYDELEVEYDELSDRVLYGE